MDRLSCLSAFVKVVELGSFARAADRLSVSTSAVSRQVADLETHLDVRLLNRTTRRLSLTEAGQSFFERSTQLLADLEEAESAVRSETVAPKGTLRITCGVTFGERSLAPTIAEFAGRHPQVSFDLDLSDLAEETGLRVEPLEVLTVFDRIEREGPRIVYHYVIVDYLCRWLSGQAVAASDALEVAWASPGELPGYDLPPKAQEVVADAFRRAAAL